jgi:homoserine dehydrogenase
MELKLAFVGFGNVARAFAQMLRDRQSQLADEYGLSWKATAIATASHGCVTSTKRIDLLKAVECVEHRSNLAELPETVSLTNSLAVIEACHADILFEATPLNIIDGEPSVTHVRSALARGMNVVTANKGPLAFAYRELKSLAAKRGLSFRFEGTVMDGAPVFNLVEECLPGARVIGFSGVLNSTTNLILTEMERGRSFEESLAEARRLGIVEAIADYDIDGWDAAMKAVALANVLMDANARPADVVRQGIRQITNEELESAAGSGMAVRLIARGKASVTGLRLSVTPEAVPISSALGSARGTSSVLVLETDLMGQIAIVESNPGVKQTAYALFSDMIRIAQS